MEGAGVGAGSEAAAMEGAGVGAGAPPPAPPACWPVLLPPPAGVTEAATCASLILAASCFASAEDGDAVSPASFPGARRPSAAN